MFTVIVGFDWSGKSSTCRPFASRYSVMPSTAVIALIPGGRAAAVCADSGATGTAERTRDSASAAAPA